MLRDFFGKEFEAGNIVVYPLRKGSSMWLEYATVMEVCEDKLKVVKGSGQKTYIKNIRTCIIAPEGWLPCE
jgi:hypothetical protein